MAWTFNLKLAAGVLAAGVLVGLAGAVSVAGADGREPAVRPVPPPPQLVKRERGEGPGDKKPSDAPPVVVKTVPEAGSEAVDPGLKEVRVTFSKTMTDKSWSWATDESRGADLDGGNVRYDADKKTCVMDVKLKPDTTYAVWLNVGRFTNFQDANGVPAVPYLLVFRTGKAK
jgi:RNA polymerase sigma-70 factor (ECF subfamily)